MIFCKTQPWAVGAKLKVAAVTFVVVAVVPQSDDADVFVLRDRAGSYLFKLVAGSAVKISVKEARELIAAAREPGHAVATAALRKAAGRAALDLYKEHAELMRASPKAFEAIWADA